MKTTAIIVGISNYKDPEFEAIPGAQGDARRFAASLTSWGLPKEWVHLILNEEATKANIVKAFYDSKSSFDSAAKLIFYFAGHGMRETDKIKGMPESALILHDTQDEDLLSTGLRLVELMQLIRILKPAQVFLFIDACSLRLDQIEHPLNDREILSTTNSRGLFCLLSSGINKSYEDARLKYGFFTNALLKSLAELRHDKEANCHTIARKVAIALQEQELPPPEVYHIGSENIWPLDSHYEQAQGSIKDTNTIVQRREALAILQDHLVSSPDPVIWMWGEGGLGKTIIAEQLTQKNAYTLYISIRSGPLGNVMQSLIEQVCLQKSELFFNRPLETSLCHALSHVSAHYLDTILIVDHLDRLLSHDLEMLIGEVDKISIPSILISRYPCPKNLFLNRTSRVLDWRASPLNLKEIEQIARKCQIDGSISTILLNASDGNALRVRRMLMKISGYDALSQDHITDEFIKIMTAIVACGGFIDEILFCNTFEIKSSTLVTLERLGLIRYIKEGCFPHDNLIEMVEENKWPLDIAKACHYWNLQVNQTPNNRSACRSLVLLASQMEDCTDLKSALGFCLETLNEKENISFIIDLVQIFKRENWEDLLLKATDYLLDHEEYILGGEILKILSHSSNRSIKHHAIKNEARRLVWIGLYGDCIRLYEAFLSKPLSTSILVSMRNTIGICYFFQGDLDKAMSFFKQNIQCQGKKEEREVGIAKHMAGLIMTYRGESIAEAKQYLEASLHIFESTKFYMWVVVAFNGLGDLSYRLHQWHQALYYFKKALEIVEALQNNACKLFTLRNITRVYLRLYGTGSKELSTCVEEMETLISSMKQMGSFWAIMWAQNTLATIYAHRKEVHKLHMIMEEVTPVTVNFKEIYIFTLANLGHLAALKRDYDESKSYYLQAFALAKQMNHTFAMQEIKQDFLGCSLPLSLQEFFESQYLSLELKQIG